jgi:hypothetical protein
MASIPPAPRKPRRSSLGVEFDMIVSSLGQEGLPDERRKRILPDERLLG